jgi:RHS repeat-associated protein
MILEETARAQGAKHPSTCEWRQQDTANGELETKTNRVTGEEWIFAYDALGNLLSVGLPNGDLVEYLVDGMGRRVGKKKNGTLQKQWIYRNALKPVAELDGSGALVSEFVYGTKSNVPDYVRRGGATYRVISDQLGSPRYVVNVADSGDVPFTATYTSFGEVTGTGLAWMPFGFAGGIYDGESGLIRFGKRDLDPTIGRWTAKDPIRFNGGQGNLFSYVDGDPVNRIDVDGRFAPGAAAGAGAGAGFAAGAAAGAAAYAFGYYVLGPIIFAIENANANDEARASSCNGGTLPPPPPDNCSEQCLPYLGKGADYVGSDGHVYKNDLGGQWAFQRCVAECRGLQ